MDKKILFITTTNLSTNPRFLKEIKLALDLNLKVEFIGFKLGNWSDKTDMEYLNGIINTENNYLSSLKSPLFEWITSTFIWKICNLLNSIFQKNLKINAFAHNKRTWQIFRRLKKGTNQYHLILAHNLGSLFPAYKYSQKFKIPFIFDIEDYHPGEKCSPDEKRRREFLMKNLLPKAAYLTFASPLIGKHSLELLHRNQIPDNTLINNCFSQNEFDFKENDSKKIQFVWFSQNIAPGRGLELVLPILVKFRNQITVTLIGNLYQQYYQEFLANYTDFIQIVEPMQQADLNKFICCFDIGLAIEVSSSDLNKDIALSNKIFAYAQSGLYILATDTSAQLQFMKEHPMLGLLCGQNDNGIEKTIKILIENIETIRKEKKSRFEYCKKMSWENENIKLKEIWDKLLKST